MLDHVGVCPNMWADISVFLLMNDMERYSMDYYGPVESWLHMSFKDVLSISMKHTKSGSVLSSPQLLENL